MVNRAQMYHLQQKKKNVIVSRLKYTKIDANTFSKNYKLN